MQIRDRGFESRWRLFAAALRLRPKAAGRTSAFLSTAVSVLWGNAMAADQPPTVGRIPPWGRLVLAVVIVAVVLGSGLSFVRKAVKGRGAFVRWQPHVRAMVRRLTANDLLACAEVGGPGAPRPLKLTEEGTRVLEEIDWDETIRLVEEERAF